MTQAVTDDFRRILRRNKRNFGDNLGFEKALVEADKTGIEPFRERKRRSSNFKRQKTNNLFNFPNL